MLIHCVFVKSSFLCCAEFTFFTLKIGSIMRAPLPRLHKQASEPGSRRPRTPGPTYGAHLGSGQRLTNVNRDQLF